MPDGLFYLDDVEMVYDSASPPRRLHQKGSGTVFNAPRYTCAPPHMEDFEL